MLVCTKFILVRDQHKRSGSWKEAQLPDGKRYVYKMDIPQQGKL